MDATADTWPGYWTRYLRGHARLATRLTHYAGLFLVPLAALVAAWWWWQPLVLLAIPIFYLAAQATHPLFEHNSNQEFATRPWWSIRASAMMLLLDLSGQLPRTLRRLSE